MTRRMQRPMAAMGSILIGACTTTVVVADDTGAMESSGAPSGSTSGELSTTTDEPDGTTSGTTGALESSSEDPGEIKLDVAPEDTDGPAAEGCIGGNDLIWVLALNDDENRQPEIYRFDPNDPGFEFSADLDCLPVKNAGDAPQSMAVTRDGTAYVAMPLFDAEMQGDFLFEFSLFSKDPCLSMRAIDWDPPTQQSSLAYVALDPEDPGSESMFGFSFGTSAYGEVRFDLPIITIEHIATTAYEQATLTGTGDGRLFAVSGPQFDTTGHLVELDPTTGDELAQYIETSTRSFPAFYGGDVLVFDQNQQDVGLWAPTVSRFDLDDDDESGAQELVEIYGEADDPPNLWIRSVASPTCVPVSPEG